jgi:hypothetical protein
MSYYPLAGIELEHITEQSTIAPPAIVGLNTVKLSAATSFLHPTPNTLLILINYRLEVNEFGEGLEVQRGLGYIVLRLQRAQIGVRLTD